MTASRLPEEQGQGHQRPLQSHSKKRHLVAFDFDYTLADANSDTWIHRCLPTADIPSELKASYEKGRWTEFMQRVVTHLHDEGVTHDDIRRVTQKLPLVEGMGQLLETLAKHGESVDCIILSDSNSLFIDWALLAWGHAPLFRSVLTNPARLDPASGRVVLEPHDSAHGCSSCPVNMCKRVTLGRFLEDRGAGGVRYDSIAYVGDGSNDLCPSFMLGPRDAVFARAGFALDKALHAPPHADPGGGGCDGGGGGDGGSGGGGGGGGSSGSGSGDGALGESRDPGRAGGAVRAAVVRWQHGGEIVRWLEKAWWGQAP